MSYATIRQYLPPFFYENSVLSATVAKHRTAAKPQDSGEYPPQRIPSVQFFPFREQAPLRPFFGRSRGFKPV